MSTRVVAVLLLGFLAGCARSSDPQLYTLVAHPGSRSWDAAAVIELRRPHIAGYLDRREIVRRVLAQRLELDHQAVWAEPLDAMLARTLVEALAQRLPNSQILSDMSQVRASPSIIVELDLQRFEQGEDELVLRALVALHGSASVPSELQQVELRGASGGGDTKALVSGMTQLVAQLADRIAGGVAARAAVAPPGVPSGQLR